MTDIGTAAPAAAERPAIVPNTANLDSAQPKTTQRDTGPAMFEENLDRMEGKRPVRTNPKAPDVPPQKAELNDDGTRKRGDDGKFLPKEPTAEAKPEAEAKEIAEPKAADTPAEDDGVEIAEDPREFAKQIGQDPDELLAHLKVTVGDKKIPLAEALKGLTEGPQVTAELQEARKKFEGEVQTVAQQWQQKMAVADALLEHARGLVGSDWTQAEKDAFLAQHGAESYIRENERRTAQQARLNQLIQARMGVAGQSQQESQAQLAEARAAERELLLKARPEWKDPTVAREISAKNLSYAKSLGFTDGEFSNLIDHRAFMVLDKARQYDELMSKKTDVTKKLRLLPKVVLPGSRSTDRADPRKATESSAITALRKNAKDPLAGAKLFESLLR